MESIRTWAFGICSAVIACGIAQMLLPKSSMQKVLNITVSVFFLGCLLSPIAMGTITLDFPDDSAMQEDITQRAKQLETKTLEQTEQIVSSSLRTEVKQILAEMDVKAEKIYINVHDDENYGISISECELELDHSYLARHDEIRAHLQKELGIAVHIEFTKE